MRCADPLEAIRLIAIPSADLNAWEAAAKRLEPITPAVSVEIEGLRGDPCKHRIWRAANSARYAASIAPEPLKTEAVALAEDLERHSAKEQAH